MKKLEKPAYEFSDVIDACLNGIARNTELKSTILTDKAAILLDGKKYELDVPQGKLYTYNELQRCHNSAPISEAQKKSYIKLYETYFVPEIKIETRAIYDAILNASKEECPFCGGIGTPKNLDHFLPKTKFPQFSVLPSNLIPSCLDCNLDSKKTSFATKPEEQTIHPYLDNPIFFEEQWITAEYIIQENNAPAIFKYSVNPPDYWDEIDKIRVNNFFNDFSIGSRYAKQAATTLSSKLLLIRSMLRKNISIEDIVVDALQPLIDEAPFKNYWEVGMSEGLRNYLRINQTI
ncbi:hypothetical protein EC844_105153 [Acinetobacter calcoaceticus]|uniref:HNH endonuclease n=1 Tax=Acinetobacter calcoaceticus TaxID=471 RepID=A0A4R1XXE9_ACICA|nr:hypothetical protein EC844_105153 [Acinetobacter calcoaceticus]